MEQEFKNKPVGIILLAIFIIISSIIILLSFNLVMNQGMILYGNMILHNLHLVYILILGFSGFFIAYGLLKGIRWSWNAAIIIMIIAAVLNVLNGSIAVILNLLIIIYLISPKATSYFGKKINLKKNVLYAFVFFAILIVLFTIFVSPFIPFTKYKLLYPRMEFVVSHNNNLVVENIDYELYYGSSSDLVWESIEIIMSEGNATLPSGHIDLGDVITLNDINENHFSYEVIWKPINKVISSSYYWKDSD